LGTKKISIFSLQKINRTTSYSSQVSGVQLRAKHCFAIACFSLFWAPFHIFIITLNQSGNFQV